MDPHKREDEQVEELKKLWNEYGKPLVLATSVFLLGYFGMNAYKGSQQKNIAESSTIYDQLITVVNDKEQATTAQHLTTELKDKFANTTYASYAAMLMAKQAVNAKQLDKAVEELQWVVTNSKDADVKSLAQLRLAKVLFAQDKTAEALALIENQTNTAYITAVNELKGDIYLSQGDQVKARGFYQQAVTLLENTKQAVPAMLQMKAKNIAEVDPSLLVAGNTVSADVATETAEPTEAVQLEEKAAE